MKSFSLLSFVFASAILLGGCSVKQTIKRADRKYDIGEYYKAVSVYRTAYPRIGSTKDRQLKAYVAHRMGRCYMLVGEYQKAELSLKNAYRFHCADSSSVVLYADVLRMNKKYGESLKVYDDYLAAHPSDEVALAGRLSAQKAKDWEKAPTRFVVRKLDFFSSKKSENSPAFPSGDSSVVYFATTRIQKGEKRKNSRITGIPTHNIYTARRNSAGEWDNIEPLEGDVNTIDDEGAPAFSGDGKQMFFTRCRYVKGQTLGAEIYCSQRSGAKWGKPQKIKLSKDSTVSFAHPAVSSDGKVLYFVSDLQGGFGGKDIWFSVRDGDKWGAPQNAGAEINSKGDEMYPTLRHDSLLYFSSNGKPGFGGLDIFCATLGRDGLWKDVHNLMYPVNSSADDFSMSFVECEGGQKGMFSSNRGERKGYDKLYSFEVPPVVFNVRGRVTGSSGEALPDATVRIVGNDGTNIKLKTKKDGSYQYSLDKNVKYVMLGNCRGYLNSRGAMTTDSMDDSHTFVQDLVLSSITRPVGISNIFFEFGRAALTKDSYKGLDKLVTLLNDNPNITIEIGAHTDRVGSAEGNLLLSGDRAQTVVDYLIKKGIDQDRLTAKGYGKSSPMVVDVNLAKQYPFLHEGQVLDDAALDQMSEEQQNIANQINRRTEFRVLTMTYKMY